MIFNVPGPSAPFCLDGAQKRVQFPISGVKDGIGLNGGVRWHTKTMYGDCADRANV
jgi:hypothetical protein